MTKIQDADAIFLGDETVDRVYLDSTQVWPSGVAPPFDPNSILNLVCWYDASDLSTLVTTTTQAFTVTVSKWQNKKFIGMLDLEQASVALRPATGTRKINNLNALEFGLTQPNIMMSSAAWSNGAPKTMFVVVQSDVVSIEVHLTSYTGGAPCIIYNWSGFWGLYHDTGFQAFQAADLLPHVVTALFDPVHSEMWIDGVSGGTGNISSDWSSQIGLGDDPGGGAGLDGLIGEYLIYNRVLTTTERQQVENYLLTKWGI